MSYFRSSTGFSDDSYYWIDAVLEFGLMGQIHSALAGKVSVSTNLHVADDVDAGDFDSPVSRSAGLIHGTKNFEVFGSLFVTSQSGLWLAWGD